uniref:GTP-binding protein n=1 Tax=Panagrolaimus sp. JU765 TaxID=591449 RepID=A0AC34R2Y7_9BILA
MSKIFTFNISLVGSSGSGKTTFIKRHQTGEFEKKYVITTGTQVYSLNFFTSRGQIIFNVVETGKETHGGSTRGQCAIIMFDVTSKGSYDSALKLGRDFLKDDEDIPVVMVGNKSDLHNPKIDLKKEHFHQQKNVEYFEMSSKSYFNYEKPFLHLTRKLLDDSTLEFVPEPVFDIPDVYFHPHKLDDEGMLLAAQSKLPDDDDDIDDDFLNDESYDGAEMESYDDELYVPGDFTGDDDDCVPQNECSDVGSTTISELFADLSVEDGLLDDSASEHEIFDDDCPVQHGFLNDSLAARYELFDEDFTCSEDSSDVTSTDHELDCYKSAFVGELPDESSNDEKSEHDENGSKTQSNHDLQQLKPWNRFFLETAPVSKRNNKFKWQELWQ